MTQTTQPEPDTPPVTFSVLIGLVSTEDRDRILETLDSLRRQEGDHACEVILADRRDDAVSEIIKERYPEARLIACPAGMSLTELRTAAFDQAAGEFVIVTEDHCVPSANWLAAMHAAFRDAPEGTAAVGGCVENGVDDTGLDWATFLCEYSAALAPVPEGPTGQLPGMNVAYRRSALAALDRSLLTKGFWETTVHPELLRKGLKLYSSNKIVLYHCKKFSFGLFARQRFIYSRYFAGLRFRRGQVAWRLAACALSAALPAILLWRICRQVWAKGRLRAELASALPSLLVFVVIWSLGEMAGYLAGQGDALSRIE